MPSRFFLLLSLAVLPLLVFEGATQVGLRDTRAVEARQEAMRLLDLVASEQLRLVEDIRHVLGTVASVGGAELGAPGCQAAFERMKPHLPDHLIVQFADQQGIVRCSTNSRALGAFIGDRANVQRALATGAFAVGGYSIAQGVGHTIFTFGLPYTGPDGQTAGVLTALLDVRWLKDYLARKPMPPEAAIVLADRDGTTLARVPEMPGLVGQPLPQQYRFMLEGTQRGIAEVVGIDGIERVVAYSPVRADVADLMVWVGLGKDHAMRPVERAMWRTLAVFVGLLGLAVLVTVWAVRHVAQLREETVRAALKMATVLESTNDAVMEVDRDWRVTFVNERAKSILAHHGNLLGQVFWEAYPELVGTEAWSCCQQAMDAQDACEFEVIGPWSGRCYAARAFPSKDGLAVFFQDVTVRKLAEQERERLTRELDKERTLLKGVLAHLPSGVFAVAAPDGRFLLHNTAAERLVRHPVGTTFSIGDYAAHGAIHPDGSPYKPGEYPLARALLHGETVVQEEMLYRRGDGTLTTFAVSSAPVQDSNGRTVMAVAIFHDITERKRMDEALRQSEERLAFALASAQAGTFDTDLRTGRILWSEESFRLFGMEPGEEGISLDTWFGLIHPDDRDRVLAERERILREVDPRYDVEHRVLRPNGRAVWVAVRGRFVFGDDGTPIRASGLYLDISARKTAEEALRRSEERLNFALKSASAGTWDWDVPSGDLTWCGGMYALHGLSPERFTPSYESWLPFVHPDDRERVQNTVLSALASTSDEYRIEHRIFHPQRGERWLMGVGRVLRDRGGAPLRLTGVSLDITARKRMEEALRRSEENLSLALASARAGTFDWDMRSGTVTWSEESYRIFGLDPQRHKASYETWLSIVHPEDRERLINKRHADFAAHRSDFQSEYRVVHPGGRVRWAMAMGRITYGEHGSPVRAVGLDIDITGRKELEEALVHSQERLKDALLAARAGSWELDLGTGEVFWSEENNALFGLPAGTIASGYNVWLDAVLPEDREQADHTVQHALATGQERFQVEFRVCQSRQEVRWLTGIGRIHRGPDGHSVRISGLNVDITERKRMEEDLRSAKQEAERASLAKSRFLAAASHDLRQPLQSLFLFAAALQGQVQTERGAKALDTLERNLEALRGLLDSLLDVSRLDADVIRPTIEDLPIGPVLDHIGASFAPIARNKGLDFSVDVPHHVVVRSDRHLLGRMVRNLVENAIKYTECGGIRLVCRVTNGHARIEVHDTGIGIPPDQRELIFVEFHQVGNPGRSRTQGLGLGLSIVQRLSRLLNHPVTLQSTQEQGSVFTVDIPLGETDAVRPVELFAAVQPDGAGRLAVLIDDDTDVLLGLRNMFRDWGYETVTGTSVEQTLERLREDGRTPVAIVSDYRLGENRTGMEAVRLVREQVGSVVPGVLLTGETGTGLYAEAAEHGLGIVIKPVTPRQLYEVLKQFLGEAA
ncbi:PAS domain-containing protein [Azospirillum sp.]|uniref:PAS domain-containing protein n=1 Tax=Azospirillum sp. TaxID=34012 RepID=UPI002D4F2885|nr:PAS domain-containing protein [Azospirillum sp.]HYD66690.1 PAS domain-containing protein [Azospirillum sp.]